MEKIKYSKQFKRFAENIGEEVRDLHLKLIKYRIYNIDGTINRNYA